MSTESDRNSDCYVFCVYTDQDKTNYDILDISRWEFYIIPTKFLNKHYPEQKRISLSTIQKSFKPLRYNQIKSEIDNILEY